MSKYSLDSRISASFKNIGLSPIVEISETARKRAPEFEQRTKKPFILFQRGEVGFDTPSFVAEALSNAATKLKLTKYPKSGGEPWLKDAIIKYLAEADISGITRDNIVVTYGGQEGLQLSFALFEGSRVVGFAPIWSCMLENIFPYTKSKVSLVPLRGEKGALVFDPSELEKALQNADLLYLNTPHNPTGKVFSREELKTIDALCKKHDVFVVSDEAYKDLVFDSRSHTSMLEFEGDNIASVFTGSKSFAATGLRFGFVVSRHKEFIDYLVRGDYTQTAGVATPAQHALRVALENKEERKKWLNQFITQLQERRDILYEGVRDLSDKVYKPEGAFYFFLDLNPFIPDMPVQDKDKYVVQRFMDAGIALVHGSAFGKGYEGFVRLSFSTLDEKLLREGILRFKETVHNLKK